MKVIKENIFFVTIQPAGCQTLWFTHAPAKCLEFSTSRPPQGLCVNSRPSESRAVPSARQSRQMGSPIPPAPVPPVAVFNTSQSEFIFVAGDIVTLFSNRTHIYSLRITKSTMTDVSGLGSSKMVPLAIGTSLLNLKLRLTVGRRRVRQPQFSVQTAPGCCHDTFPLLPRVR